MPTYLTLQCPSCGGKTRTAPGSGRFICEYCGSEHIVLLPADRTAFVAPHGKPYPPVRRPANISVEKEDNFRKYSWRWNSMNYAKLAKFSIVVDAALFVSILFSLLFNLSPERRLLLSLILGGTAIVVTYSAVAGLLNRTVITFDHEKLFVQQTPVPWPNAAVVNISDLEQLYCRKRRLFDEDQDLLGFELCARLHDTSVVTLLSGLKSPQTALYLEREIETALRITNQPVDGELAVGKAVRDVLAKHFP